MAMLSCRRQRLRLGALYFDHPRVPYGGPPYANPGNCLPLAPRYFR
jgi:hypothetical protein